MDKLLIILTCLNLIKISFQDICPFDIDLGYSSTSCQGQIGDQNVLGGEQLFFKNKDKYELLMVDYGSQGLLGVWNLTDASLFYSTSYFSDQKIQIHSIFTDKQINISDPSLPQTFIYIIDTNYNVYQSSLYQQDSTAIKFNYELVDSQQQQVQVCYNIKNNILYYPKDNYVYLRSVEQSSQLQLDSDGIQCESDFSQDYIYVLSSNNKIYMISQTNFEIQNTLQFQLGNITRLKFQQSQGLTFISYNISGYSIFSLDQSFNSTNLLFFSPNLINDYGFLNDGSLIVCGNNSMIYFGSQFINPATQSMDYNDYHVYDNLNALRLQDLKLINYTKLIVGDDFTVFYGNQTMITVVVNENRVIQLNKCLGSQLLFGVTPNAIFEGSILKTLTSSGMVFIDITSGQIKRHTSCFYTNDVPMEQVEGLYFDDELLRIYMIENQGKLGYFSFPKGEYLTQYYNLSTQSRLQFNKQGDQIYIWPIWSPQNYLVITTYLDGTFLQTLNFDNDFKVSQVYFDNDLEIILVIDLSLKLFVFNSKQFNLLYDSPITNYTVQVFQSQYGLIIVYQNLIQMLTKGQDSNHQIQINTLNLQNYNSNQTYFDTFSNSLILFNVVGTLQIAIIENPQNINIKSIQFMQKQNQVSQNVCFGNQYLVILMAFPNEIILINKQTNDLKIINFAFTIPNQCILLLDEKLLLVVSDGNQLIFIDVQSQIFLKNEQLDQFSSTVSSIQIDEEEKLLIILLSTNQIFSYDYSSLQQVCDWMATSQITLSTFQINTSYKKIIYGSGLMIYFIDYTQKKLMNQIQFVEKTQGGVIDQQTNSIFIYTNKVYQYDLQKYNLILVSQFEHLQQINQLNIIYEWNIIVTSSIDNTIAVHSYPKLKFIQLLQHDPIDCQIISTFAVDVENNRIISGCGGGSIYVWKNDKSIKHFYLLKDYQYLLQIYTVTRIIIDQANNFLMLFGLDWFPLLIQLSSIDQQVHIIQVLQGNDGAYDKHNQCILTFDQDGYLWNYNITSQSYIFRKQYPIHQGQVQSIALDPINQRFVSMGLDNKVQIWPYNSQNAQIPLFQYKNIAQIQYGYLDLIISFSNDQTVKFWEYEFSIQNSYFQIIHRASSIISYAFDENNNNLYYTRSDGNIQKWSLMDQQTVNGPIFQFNDRFNNTIYLINEDIFVIATTKQINLIYKKNLELIQKIQVECSHSVNNLEVQDSYFGMSFSEIKQNKYLIPDSYMIYTNSSSIDLLSTFMKSQLSSSSVGLITLISNQLQITNFTLEESQQENISPIVINQSQVIIDQSYFISNKLYSTQYGGGVFYFDASHVKIQNSQFIDNEAQNGGSLYFIDKCDCVLNNVTFTNNTARENGGVFLLNDSNIQIQNSTFERNKALIGGIARYLTSIPLFLKNNSSKLVKDSCGTTYQNKCIDNYGQFYGNNFCSFPQSAKINNQSLQNGSIYVFKDVQSGTQNNILKINILDEEGNQVKFQNQKNIPDRIYQEFSQYYVELQELYLLNNIQDLRQIDLKLQGATIQPFELDEFLLNQYQVSGQLGKRGRAVLQFKGFYLFSNQTQGFTDTLTIYIDYNFRDCQIGEIIQSACTSCSLANCLTCQNGTYSIEDPKSNTSNMQCKPCDYSSTISCQGSQINLKQGFWRSDKFSDDIIPCTKSQNYCNGQQDTNYCSEGLIGPLCQTCDVLGQFWNNSYGKSDLQVNCYQCQSEVLIIDKLGLIRLGNSGQIGEKSFYSRLMIRYLQIFISISSLSPKPIFNLQIISIFSPLFLQQLFPQGSYSMFQQLNQQVISLNKIRTPFILSSSSFESLVQIFTCKKIGKESFMNYYLLEKCYSTNHVILITSMIMPMTFLWIVLVPGILIYKIWKQVGSYDVLSKASLMLIILYCYLLLLQKYQPYQKIKYYKIDLFFSQICCLLTILYILLNVIEQDIILYLGTIIAYILQVAAFLKIVLIYLDVLIKLNYHLLKKTKVILILKGCLKKDQTCFKFFKSQLKQHMNSLYLLIYCTEDNSFKKFNNFQLLRLSIQDYIQRKKRDKNAPFFSIPQPNDENSFKETNNFTYSTRKTLLSKRMKEKSILKQNSSQLNPNQNSSKKFLVQFNSESQSTTQNIIFSQQFSPKVNIKFSEFQNKNQTQFDSQTSENVSEQEVNQQNNCQAKYNFRTRSNIKNINHDQFVLLSSLTEYRDYKKNDKDLDSIFNDKPSSQKKQTLQPDEILKIKIRKGQQINNYFVKMDKLLIILACLNLIKISFQNICPFNIDLGYSSANCQGQIGDQNVQGGELLFFKNQDKYEQLMVDYGSQGLLGVWNLTDASLFYSTSYFSDQKIQIHSIFTDKQINISDPSLPQTFIYIIDINFNVYQQSLYQQNITVIQFDNIMVDNQQKQIQVCFNIKNGILYFPFDNYLCLRSIEQSTQIKLDSEVIQCESDFSQDYIYVLSFENNIYKISQTNFKIQNKLKFQLGNVTHLKFQQSQGLTFISYNISGYSIFSLDQNFNQTNLLFFSPNQINDYGFLKDGSLIVCGNNSMIYFGSQFINPATQSMDYNDYRVFDNLNALPPQDLKLINYTKLIVGDDFTVFYGNQTMITVVINESRVIQLNKCLGSQLLQGVTPNAIFEGSILKTLTSSGMVFIDITNGQIKRHSSCFYTNDVPIEQVEGLYFDDELLRIYMIENQGKLGYFSFPKGEYLTQYYNLSTQSRLQFNKQGDQIYIWPFQTPQNYLVITTYLDGTFLQTLNFDNNFKVNYVYFDNDLEIIIVIDQSQKLFIFNSKQFNLLYDSPITNYTVQVFQSQYGPIIVYQNLIQMLTKGQDSHQIQINTLNLQNYNSNQTYFDTFSNSLILFNINGTLQIAIIENPQNININSLSYTQKQNQVSQNICFGNTYLVILMASPNEIILINKQTNDLKIINFAITIPNQCLILLDEELLLVVSNGNQLVFIDVQSQVFLKNEQLDQLSSTVSSIQIDKEENLLIILLSSNQIFSYDYLSLQQVCDWKATSQITLSTFQINTSYKKILYGSGLMIYFIDYTQKKLMKQIQFVENTQGGVIDQQTNSIFIYTNKVYQYDLQTYNLILVSQFEHLQQINQINIIYEWNIIMTSSLDNTIAIHSYPQLNFIQLLQHDPINCQNISTFAVDVKDNRIISGCGGGSIYVWKNDISTNNFYLLKDYQYLLQIYSVTRIIIDQTNNLLMLFGLDSLPLLVQLGSIDQQVDIIQVLQGNDGAYDKLNQCILTFDQDGYVWNYNITSQSYIFRKQYPIHQGQVLTIVLDPINQQFVSMGLDKKVQIWPYNSQNVQKPLFQYINVAQIQYGQLDLDNQILIISDSNFRIVLLSFPLLNVIQVFDQHRDIINSFILNQNSFQIISFSNDQTVKFWEYEFSIQSSYFQIIHRSSSIISYAFEEENNSLYYTRSDGNIQKWSLMDQQAINGPILQFNDRCNNTIYLINEDIFVLVTTKQINLIYKKNLELIQKIQVECSHSVNKQNIIVCGYNQQITSYQIIQNGNKYNFLKVYQQQLDKPLFKLYNSILHSTEFIIIFVNHSIVFVGSSTGLITKQFPLIHQLAIIDLIIYTEKIIFSYSFDSQLVQYLVEDNNVKVQRQTQLGYPIFQVIVNSDYILVNLQNFNYCQIYKNDDQDSFTLFQLIQTASRWQTYQQIILQPEYQLILVSSDFYYILYDYQTFELINFYQSNFLVETNFMKRRVTLLKNRQIFVQSGQTFSVIDQSEDPEQKQLSVIQQFINKNQFYENIYLQVQSDYIISVLSYNYNGINYMMTDIKGQINCQYNTNDADYFQLQKRLQQYQNLRKNILIKNDDQTPQHYIEINMYENFKFQGFPIVDSNEELQFILTINGTNYVEGIINLNQLINSQTLLEINFYNLIIYLQEEDQQQQQQLGNVQLQQLQFFSCEIIFNNKTLIAQNLFYFSFINVSITNQNIETSLIIQNTQYLILVDNQFADNNINTKQFVTFNNTVDYYQDSEFIFRNNKIVNNKINLTNFFLIQHVHKITIEQNDIFDNISTQLSFFLQTIISTNIMISYLNFNNNINLAIIDGHYLLQQSQNQLINNLELKNSYFGLSFSEIKSNKYLIPESYMIYTNSSSIDLLNTSIKSQLSNSSVSLITLISNKLQITNFTLEESQQENVSPIIINQSQVLINQSYFISNKLYSTQYGGGVFYFDASHVKIQNSQFIDNEAQNGGSLYFINMCDCLLNNVTFTNNTARENGGVFLLNDSNIQIQNSTFERNKALIGGIARYFTFIPLFLKKNKINFVKDSCGTTYQNNCIDNYGQFYGNNFCSFPQSAKINNHGTQNNILKINILDEEGNQVKFQSLKNAPDRILQEFSQYYVELQELYLQNNIQDLRQIDLKLQGATIQPFELDEFLLNQYQVSGQLGKRGRAVLQFKGFHLFSNQTQGFTDTLTIYIDYNFRDCQIGEIIQSACTSCSLANCYTCQNGTYSIQDPNSNTSNIQCKPCDYSSSISCYGSQITLKKGFWRSDKFNDDIIPCTKSQNFCNGQEDTNYCSEGTSMLDL
ncbi:WD domain, G-beta repeat protein (macronuclear) [Tetrahymena thermophila SB210]|uniref:WD domain, G-beta repeat protein n=1 Tax=Tetrahymena thermophila (strain SB210) TaxID=312017 RepID=W7XKC5_TETTS|nr:WD domain, G-beta repeat protein [Tetrahymena thermophila SB210]EWS76411.1 WD domain, G-beta repeat protein [Tetrahymena thermophila SB210]|eukprot:XP_012651035.1 WD domain, G-beta repeat protein [Tetrahymena thermophila SB210]